MYSVILNAYIVMMVSFGVLCKNPSSGKIQTTEIHLVIQGTVGFVLVVLTEQKPIEQQIDTKKAWLSFLSFELLIKNFRREQEKKSKYQLHILSILT